MVSIEPQRTHMSFDGLGNVFRTLGFEVIAREAEGRQRPLGGVIIGISINNSKLNQMSDRAQNAIKRTAAHSHEL